MVDLVSRARWLKHVKTLESSTARVHSLRHSKGV